MKRLLALVLSSAAVLATDTGIQVVSTVRTNKSGTLDTSDVFTREGQTNLVRFISAKPEAMQMHRFYYRGLLVGEFVAAPKSSGFTTEAGSPYSVSCEFGPSREVKSVMIGTKEGVILDAFMATNGVFYPADISTIQKWNDINGDLSKLLLPAHVTNTTPGQFRHEVEQLIETHSTNQQP
ncbi:MAG: hypothetical protein ABSC03_03935 [Verrucomicrobiota bacterium]|jgi:hypothetical protein